MTKKDLEKQIGQLKKKHIQLAMHYANVITQSRLSILDAAREVKSGGVFKKLIKMADQLQFEHDHFINTFDAGTAK